MKKKLLSFIILIVTLCSVCSCGKNEESIVVEQTDENQEKGEETEVVELKKNETVTVGKCEVTIKEIEYTTKSDNPIGTANRKGIAKDGYEYLNLLCGFKYLGKEKINFPLHILNTEVEYGDGFLFESDREWMYSDGHWVETMDVLPLSPETEMYLTYEIPKEAIENDSESMVIHIKLGYCENGKHGEKTEGIYKVR